MPTKHVDRLIEAYLDDQLPSQVRQQVETHLKECPLCGDRLFDARRLNKELGRVLQAGLGQPVPPSRLRHKVREALEKEPASRWPHFGWVVSTRVLSAIGNTAVIALLAFGVFAVIRGQILGVSLPTEITLGPGGENDELIKLAEAKVTATPILPILSSPARPTQTRSSLGDTIVLPARPMAQVSPNPTTELPTPLLSSVETEAKEEPTQRIPYAPIQSKDEVQPESNPPLPGGKIAFALFDPTPGIQVYQIHLINPDGSGHRQYPLRDVSEPALHPKKNDYALAFRAWNELSHPRKLMTSGPDGDQLEEVTHFWEDAQPDWSPKENRLIFASQRESDRRWRLYTAWGDGSLEVNLRREGRSPTFAPDGFRFAFESCENTGDNCGLWLGNLDNSEYGSDLFLQDPLAKSPDWSPVGEEIAYMSKVEGNWELFLVNSNGSKPRRLTHDPANDGLPAWSPDGEWLAFVSDRAGSWGLWLLHVGSGKLHKTLAFGNDSLTPFNRRPYNEQGERDWWDEQLSWGP